MHANLVLEVGCGRVFGAQPLDDVSVVVEDCFVEKTDACMVLTEGQLLETVSAAINDGLQF